MGVAIISTKSNETLTFKSLKTCADYLTSMGLKITGPTLKKLY